jgi:gas vesicle protein
MKGGKYMILRDLFNQSNKRKEKKRAVKNTAVGLSLGAMVGAVAGMLFAPKKGKETREDIAKGAKKVALDVKSTAEESFQTIKAKVKELECKKNKSEENELVEEVKEETKTDEKHNENPKKPKN